MRRPLLLAPVLLLGLSLLSCDGESTGPDGRVREAVFALAPSFPSAFAVQGSGSVVPFTRVRVTLDALDGARVHEVVAPFPAEQQSLELSITLGLPRGTGREGIRLILHMQYINASGDTVFRVGPQTVTAVPSEGGEPTPVVPVDVEYVGPGSNAASVDMLPAGGIVVAGTSTQLSATALDASQAVIANTPFVFSGPDGSRVSVTPQGLATWLPVRGATQVVATLPTGLLADTTTFTVTLPPTQLVVVSGNGQNVLLGETLPDSVVLRVAAADGVPVAGVDVTFSVSLGGGTVSPVSATSDANGLVAFAWTVGSATGVHTTSATYAGLVTPVAAVATVGQAPAVDIEYVSGDEQSGPVSTALPSPLVVRAVDAQGNGVAGVRVDFGVNLGGGSMSLAQVVTDGSGEAASFWTLGAQPGPQGAQASVEGMQTIIGFGATAVPGGGGGLVLWTGAVSSDWSVAGNWSTGAVPTTTDSVVIPTVATQPMLTATVAVGAVNVSAGTLTLNGQSLVATRSFATTGSGVLVMQQPDDAMSVLGDVLFAGGNETGLLTAGGLGVQGSFTQQGANSTASFQSGEDFVVTLTSTTPTVVFENPGRGLNDSYFGNLLWGGGGTLTQQSGVTVINTYVFSGAAAGTHVGIGGAQGRYLEVGNFASSGALALDNVRMIVTRPPGSPLGLGLAMNSLTFRNLPGTAAQLVISHPGGALVTLDNIAFEAAPTTGVYLSATDNAPADGEPLTVSVANATPVTPGAFTAVGGGATIAWPAGALRTWIGTTSTSWTEPSNWSPAALPGPLDDVTILSGTTFQPTLTTTTTIGSLNVVVGATLAIPGGILNVQGDITADGTVLVDELTGALFARGTGRTVSGNIENLAVNGVYTLSGVLNVSNDIIIRGSLDPAGSALNTTDLIMVSGGVFVMQDPADVVTVTGQAMFTGGATEGLLTDGVLRVGGRLVANTSGTGSPQNSFAPSGNHIVRPIGAGTVDIDIFTGGLGAGTSHFAVLDLSELTGSIDLVRFNTTYVTQYLMSQPSSTNPVLTTSNGGTLHTAGVTVNGLDIIGVPLTIGGGVLAQFDSVLFNGFARTATMLTIDNPGTATPFGMRGLDFVGTLDAGGRFIAINDTDGATPNALTVHVFDSAPTSPFTFWSATNGAVLVWPFN